MVDYLIIDSKATFAKNLHTKLTGKPTTPGENYWKTAKLTKSGIGKLSDEINSRLTESSIILINADASIKDGLYADQPLIDLIFWLRCKHGALNPIAFYGFRSVNRLLRDRPENFIILSPGSYHLQFPFSGSQIDGLSQLKPLASLESIKPFLKPRVKIERTRHSYANYAGMTLMLNVIKALYNFNHINLTLGKESEKKELYKDFYTFSESLDYYILKTFYSFEIKFSASIKDRKDLKNLNFDGDILLVDDLAENGWKRIISQMIYGRPDCEKLSSVNLRYDAGTGRQNLNFPATRDELEQAISARCPNLILLDLRLNGEEEAEETLEKFSGYRLLKFIKKHPNFKGIPVVMFTASRNAESVKQLIRAGAEAAWTKPGIDEGLSIEAIIGRYEDLLREVANVSLKLKSKIVLEPDTDIEELRLQMFQKMDFIKYRAKLGNLSTSAHYFNSFTDIIIDTNILEEDIETLCNIYKVSQICSKTEHLLTIDNKEFRVSVPKVLIMTYVLDELITHSKAGKKEKPFFWKTGLIAYDVVRGLLQNHCARTEFTDFVNGQPVSLLQRPIVQKKADPFLRKEIRRILAGETFELSDQLTRYSTSKSKVLFVTNDYELKSILKEQIENLKRRNKPLTGTLEMIKSGRFNLESDKISL